MALEALGDLDGALAAFGACSALLDEHVERTGGRGATLMDGRSCERAMCRIARGLSEGWEAGGDVWGKRVVTAIRDVPPECWEGSGEGVGEREWLQGRVHGGDDEFECKLCFRCGTLTLEFDLYCGFQQTSRLASLHGGAPVP